jgi:hypothetical protein
VNSIMIYLIYCKNFYKCTPTQHNNKIKWNKREWRRAGKTSML